MRAQQSPLEYKNLIRKDQRQWEDVKASPCVWWHETLDSGSSLNWMGSVSSRAILFLGPGALQSTRVAKKVGGTLGPLDWISRILIKNWMGFPPSPYTVLFISPLIRYQLFWSLSLFHWIWRPMQELGAKCMKSSWSLTLEWNLFFIQPQFWTTNGA